MAPVALLLQAQVLLCYFFEVVPIIAKGFAESVGIAFLKEPKTTIGKIVSGAWLKFKEWWDEHKREAVEKKTCESILGKLAELKKETAEQPRKPIIPRKNRGTELE